MMTRKKFITLIVTILAVVGVVSVCAFAASKPSAPVVKAYNIEASGKNRIKWKEVKRATYYRVYRATSKDGELKHVKSTTSLSYTDPNTKVGKTYYYVVKSVNKRKAVSKSSNKVKLTRKLSRSSVTLSNVEKTGKIKIKWKAVKGAEKYQVYRALTKDGKYSLIKTTTATSMTNKSTKAGQRYHYKVRAVASKAAANSAFSVRKSKLCTLAQPNLYTPKVNSAGKIVLNWKALNGTDKYLVYRAGKKTGEYKRIGAVKGKTFTDKKASAGKTYYYKIRATHKNTDANSICSVVKDVKVFKGSGLSVGVMYGDKSYPTFTWNKIKNATSYNVYRSFFKDKEFKLLSTETGLTYKNKNIPQGLTLYYRVEAVNKSGKILATSKTIDITTKFTQKEELKTRYLKNYVAKIYNLPTSSSTATRIRYMEEVRLGRSILSSDGGTWYRAFYKGKLYYLFSENLADTLTSVKSTFKYKGNTKYQQEVIDLAVDISENWKTKYTDAHTSDVVVKNGVYYFNCSSFVKYVFDSVMRKYNPAYGISADVKRLYSTTVLCNEGYPGEYTVKKVGINELQPGDVMFFSSLAEGSNERIKHIGIYLGNNEFAHCTGTWDDSVCIVSLTGNYREEFMGARRLLPTSVKAANEEATVKGPYKKYKLYADKSADATVLANIRKGRTVTVLYTGSEKWAYVETKNGVKGYMFLHYLEKKD